MHWLVGTGSLWGGGCCEEKVGNKKLRLDWGRWLEGRWWRNGRGNDLRGGYSGWVEKILVLVKMYEGNLL